MLNFKFWLPLAFGTCETGGPMIVGNFLDEKTNQPTNQPTNETTK